MLQNIAEMLRLNAPTLMKLAFDSLKDSTYKTRDTAIEDVGGFESIELSILFCNNEFIRKLNKEWRDEDHATDVLSMSQHVPELKLPLVFSLCHAKYCVSAYSGVWGGVEKIVLERHLSVQYFLFSLC